jgi:hypothetical protein
MSDWQQVGENLVRHRSGTIYVCPKVRGKVKRVSFESMISEGMAKHEEFASVNQKDVTDIRSLARLRLIFDMLPT